MLRYWAIVFYAVHQANVMVWVVEEFIRRREPDDLWGYRLSHLTDARHPSSSEPTKAGRKEREAVAQVTRSML